MVDFKFGPIKPETKNEVLKLFGELIKLIEKDRKGK